MTISITNNVTTAALMAQKTSGRRVGTTCGTYLSDSIIRVRPVRVNPWLKPNNRIRTAFDVQRVDKPDVPRFSRHHDRVRALARTKEAHTFQQRTIGHARCGEDNLLAGREIVRVVNLVWVLDSHRR